MLLFYTAAIVLAFKTLLPFLLLMPIQTILPFLSITLPVEELHRFSLALSVALYNTTAANNIANVIAAAKADSIIAANAGKESQHLFILYGGSAIS